MEHRIEHNRGAAAGPDTARGERTGLPTGFEGYDAALGRAAVYARKSRGLIALAGTDAVQFLHGILTNDIQGLEPGQACYAAYLTPQGRMLADMDVLRRAGDLLLDVEPEVRERLVERLDSSIFTEDVRVQDRSGEIASLGVVGPLAGAKLREALEAVGATFDAPPADRHVTVTTGAGELTVLGTSRAGTGAFHVFGAPELVSRLTDILAGRGTPLLGEAASESLRIEAGIPRFGTDMTQDTIPLEAGIEARAISMTKGCYVGQEVIVRILHRGQGRVARRLVGLRVEGDPPAAGTKLVSGETDAGQVTSAVRSPRQGVIALGYVHRNLAEPGVSLQLASTSVTCVVSALPFTGEA